MSKKKDKIKEIIKIKETEYYPDAEAVCSCGATFKMGSTKKKINVEVCSKCHPFYTGTQKLIDTSGRVDKFKNRLEKQKKMLDKLNKNKKQVKVEKSKNKEEKKQGDK